MILLVVVLNDQTAVHYDRLAGDIIRRRRGQKHAHARHIGRFTKTLQRNGFEDFILDRLGKLAGHIGTDVARATTLTVMFREANSLATDLEKPMMPALLAA